MRKILMTLMLGAVVLGGVTLGIRAAQPAHAMTWGELKCLYEPSHPFCKGIPPQKTAENKNNG